MSQNLDLTGRWAGHYSQHGEKHAIAAELTQQGEVLRGSMRDSDILSERSVFETAVEAGLPPGADEQIERSLRELFPDARNARIRATTSLPAVSVLLGHVQGRTVYLLKTYQGEHFVGYRVGDHRVGNTISGHAVHYQGELDEDGSVLKGQWWIEQSIDGGIARATGSFELRRTL
jgi:hypothetical protein